MIDCRSQQVRLMEKGVITTDTKQAFPARLAKIYTSFCQILQEFTPDTVAIEKAIYAKNAQIALKLGHARGMFLLAAALKEIDIQEYTPKEIKSAVTGNGNASKEQVQRMVQAILGLGKLPTPNDVADAIAVGLCHQNRNKFLL